jgi:hypothetical protein
MAGRAKNITIETTVASPKKHEVEEGVARQEAAAEAEKRERAAGRWARRIRNARITQSVLGALLSIAVAGFQGHVYALFVSTQDAAGAWPKNPNTMPTLLLLAVGITALVVDLCLLAAYARPAARMARVAFGLAKAVHYMVTSAKTVSYAISAIVMQTSFQYGMKSGSTNDLWSWTCSDAAAPMESVNHGSINCTVQVSCLRLLHLRPAFLSCQPLCVSKPLGAPLTGLLGIRSGQHSASHWRSC